MQTYLLVKTESIIDQSIIHAYHQEDQDIVEGDVVLLSANITGTNDLQLAKVTEIYGTDDQDELPNNVYFLRDILTDSSRVFQQIRFLELKKHVQKAHKDFESRKKNLSETIESILKRYWNEPDATTIHLTQLVSIVGSEHEEKIIDILAEFWMSDCEVEEYTQKFIQLANQ